MIKKILCLLLLQVFVIGMSANWKTQIGQYLKKAHDYDKLAAYLEAGMAHIPVGEKHQAVIILSYAYKEIGDSVNEKKWITRYFENYDLSDPGIHFLDPEVNVKLFEYRDRWLRKYPKLNAIAVNDSSKKVRYFAPPANLILDIDIRAPVETVIHNSKMEVIYTRYLHKGLNTVKLPFAADFKQKENRLFLLLKTGAIELNKTIILRAGYDYPETLTFDPESGYIAIEGKEFKKEESQEIDYETRKYFDKKHFFKKALLPIGIGCALTTVSVLLLQPMAEGENRTARQRAFYDGADKAAAALTIGISLKGILNVFRSFKKETKRKVRTVINPEAAAFNETLRQQIEKAKLNVFITYKLISGD